MLKDAILITGGVAAGIVLWTRYNLAQNTPPTIQNLPDGVNMITREDQV
jgi:hypothetical protein